MKTAYIYLENGVFFQAKSFGAEGTQVGEVVFNIILKRKILFSIPFR